MTALEVMAENTSVHKVVTTLLTLTRDHKSPVIKSNMAKIIDSVITRYKTRSNMTVVFHNLVSASNLILVRHSSAKNYFVGKELSCLVQKQIELMLICQRKCTFFVFFC